MTENKQAEEWSIITEVLIPEFRDVFTKWNMEYSTQERDLGLRAEFVNLWRKTKKVKAAVWDGADTANWREGLRLVLLEIIGHAFLMLFDLDKQNEISLNRQFESRNAKLDEPKKRYYKAEGTSAPRMVPNCGHQRCIDHSKVLFLDLAPGARQIYNNEVAQSAKGHVPAAPEELGLHD